MLNLTLTQFDKAAESCSGIFFAKMKDYGTAWRILRLSSITDQIFIKAQRIRSIEEKGNQKIAEGIASEYKGIVNYSVIGLIQLNMGEEGVLELPYEEAVALYKDQIKAARNLMEDKNHDYGEAWRKMRISSLTDLILMKLLRIKQIEDNEGDTVISEGIDANYYDIINYAIFALIRLDENKN
jgi:hypothetical protein